MKYTQSSFELFVESLSEEQVLFLLVEIESAENCHQESVPNYVIDRLKPLLPKRIERLDEQEKNALGRKMVQKFSKEIISPYHLRAV